MYMHKKKKGFLSTHNSVKVGKAEYEFDESFCLIDLDS